ncbi:MAG: MotA/TolQ/ExbB proton channel family protein [Pirellulaceae bacterium]
MATKTLETTQQPTSVRLPAQAAAVVVPTALGGAVYLLLTGLLDGHIIDNPLVNRYLVGHPISRITTCMFCVGMVHLFLIWRNQRWQIRKLDSFGLEGVELTASASDSNEHEHRESAQDQAQALLRGMLPLGKKFDQHFLYRRLITLLGYVGRNGATSTLEGEMKYLSESDAEQQHQSCAFVRILIWATPMLGFLGTVLGISAALGQLNVGPDNDLQGMMAGLQSSLYVAFDTTAQALVLSMFMMFSMFFVERIQQRVLSDVDARTIEEISNQFEFQNQDAEVDRLSATKAVQRVGGKLLKATREAVSEHTRIWKKTIEAAENSWVGVNVELAQKNQEDIGKALKVSLDELAATMDGSIRRADESMSKRWHQWQTLLSDNSRNLDRIQQSNQGQVELLSTAIERMNQIIERQDAQKSEEAFVEIIAAVRLLKDELLELKGESEAQRKQRTFQLKVAEETRRAA